MQHFPVNIPVSRNALENLNLKIEMIMYKANKDKTISIEKRQMGVMLFHIKVLVFIIELLTGTAGPGHGSKMSEIRCNFTTVG